MPRDSAAATDWSFEAPGPPAHQESTILPNSRPSTNFTLDGVKPSAATDRHRPSRLRKKPPCPPETQMCDIRLRPQSTSQKSPPFRIHVHLVSPRLTRESQPRISAHTNPTRRKKAKYSYQRQRFALSKPALLQYPTMEIPAITKLRTSIEFPTDKGKITTITDRHRTPKLCEEPAWPSDAWTRDTDAMVQDLTAKDAELSHSSLPIDSTTSEGKLPEATVSDRHLEPCEDRFNPQAAEKRYTDPLPQETSEIPPMYDTRAAFLADGDELLTRRTTEISDTNPDRDDNLQEAVADVEMDVSSPIAASTLRPLNVISPRICDTSVTPPSDAAPDNGEHDPSPTPPSEDTTPKLIPSTSPSSGAYQGHIDQPQASQISAEESTSTLPS